MKRKKFSKKRFYRRLQAQKFAKGGFVTGGDFTPLWLMSCCEGFPNLAKAAGKAAEKFQEVVESIKKIDFQPPNIKPLKTKIFIDGVDLGAGKDFSVTYSST
ncbi:hypothetical protein OHW01_09230 [Acinetobacter baumannii]|uniref:hypothetical protein n=1 Tax=Acinetobacter baumannii TaxID=470 RepID=UPI0018A88731|nr:hypothetical protein [Acinetobacter baumannii]MDC4671128.1 hypothetical protein [Acinetobacter baumannii]MDC4710450.1 hypothetical protein [Acinetobacter baumannii]MDC4808313.1 hypothetical protein [Acinetobacter baumannii]MDC4811643.1 hypothetical protein [Acinetobacter baumannii]MDC4943421.1 hypothetical protein [Acinetobacter baumannii]